MTQQALFPGVPLPRTKPVNHLVLDLWHDEDVEDPADGEDWWKLVSFNRRHGKFEDPYKYLQPLKKGESTPDAVNIGFARKLKVGTAFILSCYEHGGIAWSLGGEGMQDRWDTARIAGLLIFTGDAKDLRLHDKDELAKFVEKYGKKPTLYQEREIRARSFLEEYNEWLNGSNYGYTLTAGEEEIESTGGYIGAEYLAKDINLTIAGFVKDYPAVNKVYITGDEQDLADYHDFVPKGIATERINDVEEIEEGSDKE